MIPVTDVRFVPALALDQRVGLLGWASAVVFGAFRLHGLAVRRTRAGELVVTLATRSDRPIVTAVTSGAHAELEDAVIRELVARGEIGADQ